MSPTRVLVDDDEQQIADLIKQVRTLRSRLATTAIKGSHDEFTAAATPATTYTLTYIPLTGTCLMALNGHVQREGTDYTCDYDTGIVTVSATQAASDKLTFRYLITDWLVARSAVPDIGSFSDNFNRADAAALGAPWTVWNEGGGSLTSTWNIASNRAYCSAETGGGNAGIAYVDMGSPDGTLQATIAAGTITSTTGLIFRIITGAFVARSFFLLQAGQLFYFPPNAGGTSIGTLSTALGVGDVGTVVMAGSSIVVQRNGSTVLSVTNANNLAATKHGLAQNPTFSPTTRFDDFSWVGA